MAIPITEEFDNPQGRFINYDTANIDGLTGRAHINLRSFSSIVDEIPYTMYSLAQAMSALNPLTMADLEGAQSFIPSESWTVGTFGPDPALAGISTLRLTLAAGATTTESVGRVVSLANLDGELCVALPNFPAASLNLSSSYLELSDGTNSVQLPFTGVAAGNVEASWPVADLGAVLAPTTVRFHFVATGAATVKIAALRLLSADWTPTQLDINTIYQRLEATVDRVGNIPTDTFPRVWRADPAELDDPLPINSKLAINFNSGTQDDLNTVSLYLRGRREDFLTQLDLDGVDYNSDGIMEYGTSQGDLNNYGVQPDYGRAMYNPRPQDDYNEMSQTTLDTYTQAELERAPDLISESYIKIEYQFGTTNLLTISTTETDNDTEIALAVPALTDSTAYLLLVDLIDSRLRVSIRSLDAFGRINRETVVYDTNEIVDDFLLKRRKGLIGWSADLSNGAYINSVRSRGLMFAEFITQNFESLTPVEGARLFVGATPDEQIPLSATPVNGGIIELDVYNSQSADGAIKLTTTAGQGLQSQEIVFEDFANTEISFDIFYPRDAIDNDALPAAYLANDRGLFIPLFLPSLIGDQWQKVTILPMRAYIEQTGEYRVTILQNTGAATFWLDNMVVKRRSIAWAGRSTILDPWGRESNAWTEFRSLINSDIDGAMFPRKDRFLQIRGQALTQDATINKVYAKPKYAELGRLVWDVNRQYND